MRATADYSRDVQTYRTETYQFVVVCSTAQQVFLIGDFNNWSTSATPMCETDEHVWELAVEMESGEHKFGYFVIDREFGTGRAAFGSTYLLPGTWAAVTRRSTGIRDFVDAGGA